MKNFKIGDKITRVPLIQGGMGVGISLGRLAGSVAKAGGVGIISTAQIGYREEDFDRNPAAAKERGIIVTNIPAYSTASVAQMVFAHILNICQQVQHHSEEVHKGRWTNNKDFCFCVTPLIELRDKQIGLVGL